MQNDWNTLTEKEKAAIACAYSTMVSAIASFSNDNDKLAQEFIVNGMNSLQAMLTADEGMRLLYKIKDFLAGNKNVVVIELKTDTATDIKTTNIQTILEVGRLNTLMEDITKQN